jgi:hypothetical protein
MSTIKKILLTLLLLGTSAAEAYVSFLCFAECFAPGINSFAARLCFTGGLVMAVTASMSVYLAKCQWWPPEPVMFRPRF